VEKYKGDEVIMMKMVMWQFIRHDALHQLDQTKVHIREANISCQNPLSIQIHWIDFHSF